MSASEIAIPLWQENSDWKNATNEFICITCNYEGHVSDLLCEPDNDTLYCPICKLANWEWK